MCPLLPIYTIVYCFYAGPFNIQNIAYARLLITNAWWSTILLSFSINWAAFHFVQRTSVGLLRSDSILVKVGTFGNIFCMRNKAYEKSVLQDMNG